MINPLTVHYTLHTNTIMSTYTDTALFDNLFDELLAAAGKRMRKAGAKHNKFDAEAAGKKKNNKNGLVH